jgi:uncharacterized membrane protein YoaK (UPF0700 family)
MPPFLRWFGGNTLVTVLETVKREQFATNEREKRVREALMVLLAVNSGATDAIGLLCLGGAFASVMTGNMVLLGVSVFRLDSSLAVRTVAAIVYFVAGCALGTRIAGRARPDDPVWPRSVTLALQIQFLAMAVYAIGWELTGGRPGGAMQVGLLLINALALGMQSSTVARFGVSGLSTTYLTGTLTTLVIHVASGRGLRNVQCSAQILGGLIGGAALGGILAVHLPPFAPAVQLVSVAVVILMSGLARPAESNSRSNSDMRGRRRSGS